MQYGALILTAKVVGYVEQETISRLEAAKAQQIRESTPIVANGNGQRTQRTLVQGGVADDEVLGGDLLPHSLDIMIQVQICMA
jgi:hypothetical protein